MKIFRPKAESVVAMTHHIHWRRSDKAGNEGISRLGIDFLGSADLAHGAGFHYDDAIAQAHGFHLIVGHINRRCADAPLKLLQLVARRGAQLSVEIGKRFIQ